MVCGGFGVGCVFGDGVKFEIYIFLKRNVVRIGSVIIIFFLSSHRTLRDTKFKYYMINDGNAH